MKLKRKSVLLATVACTLFCSFTLTDDKRKDEALAGTIFQMLATYHYQPQILNDSLSVKAFNLYLKRLDFGHMYLTKGDVAVMETYKYKIDDELEAKTFNLFNLSIEIIDKRIAQVRQMYPKILTETFDYTQTEIFETDEEKRSFPANEKEMEQMWRSSIKTQIIDRIYLKQQEQEKAKAKNDTIQLKTFEQLETEAREFVKKRYDGRFKRAEKTKRDDRLSLYFNSIINVFDPHTGFFPPADKEDFDINISGKLEGIGATLSEKDGYIKVEQLVPGSASWRQGQLQVGDVILKVAQGDDEAVEIVDMRLDEAVRLIRGPKGTKVVLTCKKIDGSIVQIPIIRDVVVIEDTYAKSTILTDKDKKKRIGYLYLPKFYVDFNNANGRNCSDDIRIELQKLQKAGVDGIIFDLRDNGGGSLGDVVKIGGFFIEKGPIVQVKSRMKTPEILEDRDPSVVYNGPLVVMVNSFSASASEILAAAMQDYGRAIVVGSKTSYGKGTVQRFVSLDQYTGGRFSELGEMGDVKVTIQKFYRINGGTTQLEGVKSDIVLPERYAYLEVGEKENDYPMGWDTIPRASYRQYPRSYDVKKLARNSAKRIEKDTSFQLVEQAAQWLKTQRDDTKTPLNYTEYVAREKKEEQIANRYKYIGKWNTGLEVVDAFDKLQVENKLDSIKQQRVDTWHKDIKHDLELFETFRIILDML